MRASSKAHVEYEVLRYIINKIDFTELEDRMCPKNDKKLELLTKRFNSGANSICEQIQNKIKSRKHKLPKKHPAYEAKE